MKDFLTQFKKATMIVAITSIAIGAVFLFFPSISLKVICIIIGALFIFIGLVLCGFYFFSSSHGFIMVSQLILGIIITIFGVVVCVKYQSFVSVLQIIIGAFVVVEGITNIFRSAHIIKNSKSIGIISLLFSVLIVIIGISIIANPFDSAKTFTSIIGIALIAYGVVDLVTSFKISSAIQNIEIDNNTVYYQDETKNE